MKPPRCIIHAVIGYQLRAQGMADILAIPYVVGVAYAIRAISAPPITSANKMASPTSADQRPRRLSTPR